MHVCDLTSGLARLQRASARLRDRWAETQQTWTDNTSEQFRQEHLDPLLPMLAATRGCLHQLMETLEKAERELDDQP